MVGDRVRGPRPEALKPRAGRLGLPTARDRRDRSRASLAAEVIGVLGLLVEDADREPEGLEDLTRGPHDPSVPTIRRTMRPLMRQGTAIPRAARGRGLRRIAPGAGQRNVLQ